MLLLKDDAVTYLAKHQCACGNVLQLGRKEYILGEPQYHIICPGHPDHQDFERIRSDYQRYEEGEDISPSMRDYIEGRELRKMTEQVGEEKAKALIQYRGVTSLTRQDAIKILTTVFPGAPDLEVVRAAMLCASYNLNPLMKHVYLIPFNKGKPTETWVTVMGIKAKRVLAARRGRYGYVDDSPRVMTEKEQTRIRGKVEPDKIWAITVLRDGEGNEARGYGSWLRSEVAYGGEKGNSPENMAMIRSESAALDRLYPGEMPQDVEAMDERFLEGQFKEIESPSENPEPTSSKPSEPHRGTSETPQEQHQCSIHNTIFFKRGNMKGYAHPLEGGAWCNEDDLKPDVVSELDEPPVEELEGATSVGEAPTGLMTRQQFKDRVEAAFPKWKEDAAGLGGMICKYLGCTSLDQWGETWETAIEMLERHTQRKIA